MYGFITILDIIHLSGDVSKYIPPEDGDMIQSWNRCLLNERQDDG
jgi:hypothetical protein